MPDTERENFEAVDGDVVSRGNGSAANAAISDEVRARYEPVIGLEVHAQLLTRSKAFSGAASESGSAPNVCTDPVVLGHPGTLPTINRETMAMTVRMGLATHCEIRRLSTFARKNYFYPDLPKGYQISQYDDPICYDGWIEIEGKGWGPKRVGITRIHMEEDSGKSIHDLDPSASLVDLNRAGVSLIEIVSEPDIRSAEEAYAYLTQIKSIVTWLGICSGIMEEGALRCDANISVRPVGREAFGTKTEVKNLNSFRGVEKAIEFEIARQIALIESGGTVVQETRLWDANVRQTRAMRSKEEAHDYRYFPEPDLPPVVITDQEIEALRTSVPELAVERKHRFVAEYGIPSYDAAILTESRDLADYFESACAALKAQQKERFKIVSNVIMTDILRELGESRTGIAGFPVEPSRLAQLADLFADDKISSKNMKDIFAAMLTSPASPEEISAERGFTQNSDTGMIEQVVDAVLTDNADSVAKYREGKTTLFGFFVGETMKRSQGKANPKLVNEYLRRVLDGESS